jgi:hypothetical protein
MGYTRSNKKRQRKIDVKPVESQIEQVRNDERAVGAGGVGGMSDGKLFSIDNTGNEQVRKRARFLKIDEASSHYLLTKLDSQTFFAYPWNSFADPPYIFCSQGDSAKRWEKDKDFNVYLASG